MPSIRHRSIETAYALQHAFHLHCINRWLKSRNVCPLDNREWELVKVRANALLITGRTERESFSGWSVKCTSIRYGSKRVDALMTAWEKREKHLR